MVLLFRPDISVQIFLEIARSKKRDIDPLQVTEIPQYNAGERCSPRAKRYVEVTSEEPMPNARNKNLIWIIVRLHAKERQKASSWTGFNISVRNEVEVTKDNNGYLPTINVPATEMATVNEVLVQSLKIKNQFKLKSIVLVFDQALYAKATEIQWKHDQRFKDIVLRMGCSIQLAP